MNINDIPWNPMALYLWVNKVLPKDWLTWEPITVYDALEEMGVGRISEVNASKLNAMRTIHLSPVAWTDWDCFEKVGKGLTGFVPNFELVEPLSIVQCMIAVFTMNNFKEVKFSSEVVGYIASCAKHEELEYLPDPLSFVQTTLCKPMYKCHDCGTVDHDDLPDGRCDVCSERFMHETNVGHRITHPSLGTNITKFHEYDYWHVAKRFSAVRSLPYHQFDLDITSTDIQVAKLLWATDKLREYENAFREQYGTFIR